MVPMCVNWLLRNITIIEEYVREAGRLNNIYY